MLLILLACFTISVVGFSQRVIPTAGDADLAHNRILIRELMIMFKDDNATKQEKIDKFKETQANLRGEFKNKVDQLFSDIDNSIDKLSSKEAKAAAGEIIDMLQSGCIYFGSIQKTYSDIEAVLSNLSPADQDELRALWKEYENRVKTDFMEDYEQFRGADHP